jgi:thiosulfate/3-mercaptopyruvate sulfurtransferase
MTKILKFSVLGLLFLFTANTFSQSLIITAKDFAAEMKSNKSLVVIDANSPENYAKQHIQGAINIWHQDLYKKDKIEGLLKSPEELAAIFGKKGLTISSPMVIYDDGSQKYNSNLYTFLVYLGAENIRLLHRDPATFEQARITMSSTPVSLKAQVFTPVVRNDFFSVINEIKAANDPTAFVIVDVRDKEEFEGKVEKSKGHIPGSIHLNFKDMLTDKGAFKSKEELEKIASTSGITADKTIYLYCYTGVKAAVTYIALKNILGFQKCKIYEGSYNEWVADVANPINK